MPGPPDPNTRATIADLRSEIALVASGDVYADCLSNLNTLIATANRAPTDEDRDRDDEDRARLIACGISPARADAVISHRGSILAGEHPPLPARAADDGGVTVYRAGWLAPGADAPSAEVVLA